MIEVVLDPKIAEEYPSSHHESLGGFLRMIGARIVLEDRLIHSKLWQAISTNNLASKYQWLWDDAQTAKTYSKQTKGLGDFEEIYKCRTFLTNYRPRLVTTTSKTIRQCLSFSATEPKQIQAYYRVVDPTEDFEYKAKGYPATRYYGGFAFSDLNVLNLVAAHWKYPAPVPSPRDATGLAYMKSLLKSFCFVNSAVYIFDRTICDPIAYAVKNNRDGRDVTIFKLLQEITKHPNVEKLVIATKALPSNPKDIKSYDDDTRKETYAILKELFDSSSAEIEFYSVNEGNAFVKTLFKENSSRPYELGALVGSFTKYDWHHFSVAETAHTLTVRADLIDKEDTKAIRTCKQLANAVSTGRPSDGVVAWSYDRNA
jgi:hypothetical protein